MLYWKYSSTRVFFLNEHWILIPSAILRNYVIIRRIRSHKEKIRLLKRLKAQLEREKKTRQILALGLGLNWWAYLLMRGSQNIINVDYIQCNIDKGLQILDDMRLRNIIDALYSHKRKGRIIYITVTAACHLINHSVSCIVRINTQ